MIEYGYGEGGKFYVGVGGEVHEGPFATPGQAKRRALELDPKAARAIEPIGARPAPVVVGEDFDRRLAETQAALEEAAAKAAEVAAHAAIESILEGSVAAVRAALATGEYDEHLARLRIVEEAGKNRKGVLGALDERRA
jgi:hypothetical protein